MSRTKGVQKASHGRKGERGRSEAADSTRYFLMSAMDSRLPKRWCPSPCAAAPCAPIAGGHWRRRQRAKTKADSSTEGTSQHFFWRPPAQMPLSCLEKGSRRTAPQAARRPSTPPLSRADKGDR